MPYTPPTWGGSQNSKDYELKMQGATPTAKPISLVGHALTSPNQELSDPVTRPYVEKQRGRIRNFVETIRPAEQIALTYTMLFGSGLWTPALHKARQGNACPTVFYAIRLCPPNSENEHAFVYPDAILNPPVRVNDFITIEDTTIADWQTEMRVSQELMLWGIGGYVQANITEALYAVTFLTDECFDCDDAGVALSELIAVGGDGAADLIILKTDDRFATSEEIANGAPAGSVGRAIWSDGNLVLIGFDDGLGIAAGVVGGTLFSSDRGETFTIDANITAPIRGVGFFNGQYVAVGGTGAGIGLFYVSDDGINWTSITSAQITGTWALTALAVDNWNGAIFVTGETGKLLKGTSSGDSIQFADISANLPGAPGTLNTVAVLDDDHIVVGGAAGYAAESFDGGASFVQIDVPGSAAVLALSGTPERVMAGSSTNVSERSVLNDFQFENRTLQNGATITGDVTGLAHPDTSVSREDAMNYFAATTDDGEIVLFRPFFPGS